MKCVLLHTTAFFFFLLTPSCRTGECRLTSSRLRWTSATKCSSWKLSRRPKQRQQQRQPEGAAEGGIDAPTPFTAYPVGMIYSYYNHKHISTKRPRGGRLGGTHKRTTPLRQPVHETHFAPSLDQRLLRWSTQQRVGASFHPFPRPCCPCPCLRRCCCCCRCRQRHHVDNGVFLRRVGPAGGLVVVIAVVAGGFCGHTGRLSRIVLWRW